MYAVIELQRNNNVLSTIVTTYSDLRAAEAKYHQILSVAALSSVELHGATLLEDTGRAIYYQVYDNTNNFEE